MKEGAESENSAEIGSGCMRCAEALSAVVHKSLLGLVKRSKFAVLKSSGGVRNELSDGELSIRIIEHGAMA